MEHVYSDYCCCTGCISMRHPDVIRALKRSYTQGFEDGVIFAAQDKLDKIGELLSDNGCDCECNHNWEDHSEDCKRCLACRIDSVIGR